MATTIRRPFRCQLYVTQVSITIIIIGASVSILFLFVVLFCWFYFYFWRKRYLYEKIEYLGHLHIIKLRMFTLIIIFYRFFLADCLIDALRLVCVCDTLQEIFVDERSLFCIHLLWVTGVFIIKLTRDVAGNVVVLTHKLHTNFKSLFFIIIILNSHFLLFFKTHWKHACSLFLCAPCFHVINSTCTC